MKTLLKLEELAQLLAAAVVFAHLPFAWWVFPATLFLPDLSMLGYLAGPCWGAAAYNLGHHKALALGLGLLGWLLAIPGLQLAGTMLFAHAAFDRTMGYGLKYATGFKFTHLGAIGQAERA
jgi:hypothetical protein